MKTFDIIYFKGHILFDNGDGLVLVDTGSPTSFHESGVLKLGDETLTVPTSFMGVNTSYISRHVGMEVKGLLGMDYIGMHDTLVDLPGGKVVFDSSRIGFKRVPSFFAGCAGIVINVNGRDARMYLDTGAPTSYISRRFTEGETPCERKKDFSPFSPTDIFETDIYYLETTFADETFRMEAGTLPPEMGMMLTAFGVDGVAGLEIFKRMPVLFAGGMILIPEK